jgi:biopolymer transport protein TolR
MPKLEPIPSASNRDGGGRRRSRSVRVSSSLAEINVVPLVDVMLVLLVIFMVAAPMMQQGFPVELPEARQSRAIAAPVTITVPGSFRTDQRVQIDGEFVSLGVLTERVRQAIENRTDKSVMLAGDDSVTYGEIVSVFDLLQAGGVTSVNLQTQPAARRR